MQFPSFFRGENAIYSYRPDRRSTSSCRSAGSSSTQTSGFGSQSCSSSDDEASSSDLKQGGTIEKGTRRVRHRRIGQVSRPPFNKLPSSESDSNHGFTEATMTRKCSLDDDQHSTDGRYDLFSAYLVNERIPIMLKDCFF